MLHSHLSHGKEIRELQIIQTSVGTALPTTCLLLILKTVVESVVCFSFKVMHRKTLKIHIRGDCQINYN